MQRLVVFFRNSVNQTLIKKVEGLPWLPEVKELVILDGEDYKVQSREFEPTEDYIDKVTHVHIFIKKYSREKGY